MRPLIPDVPRTEDMLSQQPERVLATDAVQQQSVAAERFRSTKLQRDRLERKIRETPSHAGFIHLRKLILPAQCDVHWNQAALNRIKDSPGRFKFRAKAVRHEQAELPARALGVHPRRLQCDVAAPTGACDFRSGILKRAGSMEAFASTLSRTIFKPWAWPLGLISSVNGSITPFTAR